MSLLSTFSILFEIDSEDALRGMEKTSDGLDNLSSSSSDAAVAVDDAGQSVSGFGSALGPMRAPLLASVAGVLALGAAFGSLLVNQAGVTDFIGKFSETRGLDVSEVGAWGEAVERSGGSVEGFMGTISGLQDKLTDISLTGGGDSAEVFARLGISAVDASGHVKRAFDILPQLADSFSRLSKTESVAFGQKLGLDQGTILLLQQGRVAVEDLLDKQKKLGVATKEDAAIAAEFNDSWADTSQIFDNFKTKAGSSVLPVLTAILDGFRDFVFFLNDHEGLVTGFIVGVAGALAYFFLPAMISAAAATWAFIAPLLVAAAPFIAIGAAVAAAGVAIALLVEDIFAFANGQDSLIGKMAEKWEWFGDSIEAVSSVVGSALEYWHELIDSIVKLWDKLDFSSFDNLKESVGGMFDDIGGEVSASVSATFDDAKKMFGFTNKNEGKSTKEILSSLAQNDVISNQVSTIKSESNINNSTSRKNDTKIDKIEINVQSPNSDPNEVAHSVGSKLQAMLSNAKAQFDDAEAY